MKKSAIYVIVGIVMFAASFILAASVNENDIATAIPPVLCAAISVSLCYLSKRIQEQESASFSKKSVSHRKYYKAA